MTDKTFPIIQYVLYNSPRDFPNEFIVRKWGVDLGNQIVPLEVVIHSKDLEKVREYMDDLELHFIPRFEGDDKNIMGVWL